jgi:hypothetical protein
LGKGKVKTNKSNSKVIYQFIHEWTERNTFLFYRILSKLKAHLHWRSALAKTSTVAMVTD